MPLCTISVPKYGSGKDEAGVQLREQDGTVKGYVVLHDLRLPRRIVDFLALGQEGFGRLRAGLREGEGLVNVYPPSEVTLRAPMPDPRKVIGIGLNYKDHAEESGMPLPTEPVLFMKSASTGIIGPGQAIVIPMGATTVDYEAELVIVVGRGGRNLSAEQAAGAIAGYTCGHDVSERTWQLKAPGGQWTGGKMCDTFAPIGPVIVAADRIDPLNLRIQLRLNGQTMQDSNTRQMNWGPVALVSFVSQRVTLEPGDLIFTGTPPGIGHARKPPVYLKAGDVCQVEIEQIGVLENAVV